MSLMEEQLSAVKAVYEGQDVFFRLPTGYGKSLCYQTLPFLMEHKLGRNRAILVVSSLVGVQGLQSSALAETIYSFVLWKPLPQQSGEMPLKERDSLVNQPL